MIVLARSNTHRRRKTDQKRTPLTAARQVTSSLHDTPPFKVFVISKEGEETCVGNPVVSEKVAIRMARSARAKQPRKLTAEVRQGKTVIFQETPPPRK